MIRRYGTGRLRDTSRRRREDVDPMRGLANMADVMENQISAWVKNVKEIRLGE